MASPLQKISASLNSPAALSFSVGLFLAIIGATSGIGPLAILFIALIYFWKERSRARLLISIPVFQYLIVQFSLTWWHSGEIFANEMQTYYLLLLFSVPFIHFMMTDFEFDERLFLFGIVAGLAISTALLTWDYYSTWNFRSCRAKAFQTNPLRTSLHIVPLASLVILMLARKASFGWLSAILVVLMLFVSGSLVGARMTFYSVFFTMGLLAVYFLWHRNFAFFIKLVLSLVMGFIFVLVFDWANGCNFSKRLSNNFVNVLAMTVRPEGVVGERIKTKVNPETPEIHSQLKEKPETGRTGIEDTSERIRAELWQQAIKSIMVHPILGEGAIKEKDIVRLPEDTQPRGGVSHNQFISWAIWGGVVSVISALVFMGTHLLTTQNRFAATLFIIPWLISSLTISTFYQVGTMAEFVVTLTVLMPLLGIKKTRWIFSRPR